MIIRKMLLLASMALAVVAFAAPAVAQADAFWTTTSGTVGGEGEGVNVEAGGFLTTSFGGLNTMSSLRLEGIVWNGAEHGEGSIEAEAAGGFVPGIPTSICTVAITLVGEPWGLTLTTDPEEDASTNDATVDLGEVGFINHYSHGCITASGGAIPTKAAATGTVTATASTDGDHVDLTFEATQDLYPTDPETWIHKTTEQHVGFTSHPSSLVLWTFNPEVSIGVEQH
jgi:hypothetical protein